MSHKNDVAVTGTILQLRGIEDCIRATKKYKEYIGTMRYHHPIQGAEFPSEKFTKSYEVYPDMEVSWDMPASQAMDWLWGDTIVVTVKFIYDYRNNEASMKIRNGALRELYQSIPGLKEEVQQIKDKEELSVAES